MMENHEHRSWPPPDRPWIMRMTWSDLLFAHWPVDAAVLRPLVPEGLEIGTFDGSAWVGVTPFRMSGVRARWLPPVPGASAFEELNVRTYVTVGGKPGVWFFSLDAANGLAVKAARWGFSLNYWNAKMRCEAVAGGEGGWIEYESERLRPRGLADSSSGLGDGGEAVFRGRYRPVGEVFRSEPGSLEMWLAERYCLYAEDRRGRLYRGEIHHAPWPLQRAEAEIEENTMTRPLGVALPNVEPHLLFARRLDMVAWWLERV